MLPSQQFTVDSLRIWVRSVERSTVRFRAFAALFFLAALGGCRSAPPSPVKPALAPPVPSTARRVAEIARDLEAIQRAEPDLPKWTFLDLTDVAGASVERYVLPDGTRVLFVPDPSASALTYQTWFTIGAGPDGEREGAAGARRRVEAARSRPGTVAMRRLERLGAMVGAGTVGELGYFTTTIPWPAPETAARDAAREGPSALDILLEIEAERWATAKKEPVPESSRSAPSPPRKDRSAGRRVDARKAPPEEPPPAQAPTPRESMERALRARIASGASRSPSVKRAVIAVAGRLERRDLLERMRRGYRAAAAMPDAARAGAPAEGGARHPDPSPGPSRGDGAIELMLDPRADSDRVLIGWPIPEISDGDQLSLEAIAYILAEGVESRLGRALLPSVALAVEAEAPRRGGSLEVLIALKHGQTATTAIAVVDREVQAIARGETTGLEVEVLKSTLRAEALNALDGLEERATAIARADLTAGDPGVIARRLTAIASMSEREIRAATAKYLIAGSRISVVGLAPSRKTPAKKAAPRPRGRKPA